MNEFTKWVIEHLDTREDIQRKLKTGDMVRVLQQKDESNICEFLGYEKCKWIDHYVDDVDTYSTSCHNCKGKFYLRDTVTGECKMICGTFTIGKENYSRVKLIRREILSEDLFEI